MPTIELTFDEDLYEWQVQMVTAGIIYSTLEYDPNNLQFTATSPFAGYVDEDTNVQINGRGHTPNNALADLKTRFESHKVYTKSGSKYVWAHGVMIPIHSRYAELVVRS